MKDKRGLEIAVTTVIVIVLSIAVLTVLVIVLNSQTSFLSRWFKSQTTESNVDAISSVCDNLVTIESIYAYCCENNDVILANGTSIKMTCEVVAEQDWAMGRVRALECSAASCPE